MSKMTRSDDIDDVVSSVRDFVSYKDKRRTPSRTLEDRLLLTPEQRIVGEDGPVDAAPDRPQTPDGAHTNNVHPLKPSKPEDLEATIAELEAAVTAQSGEWEADEGEDFVEAAWAASAFEAPVEDDVSEPVMTQEPEPTPEPTIEPEPTVEPEIAHVKTRAILDPTEDLDMIEAAVASQVTAGLDEEALRALVVATVHQELSGELGERITRNVRKLVRREINRVLTSREMGQG